MDLLRLRCMWRLTLRELVFNVDLVLVFLLVFRFRGFLALTLLGLRLL